MGGVGVARGGCRCGMEVQVWHGCGAGEVRGGMLVWHGGRAGEVREGRGRCGMRGVRV